MYLSISRESDITGNTLSDNQYGIHSTSSPNSKITSNTILRNNESGIFCDRIYDSEITNNTISECKVGLYLFQSSKNAISNNQITSNDEDGIYLNYSYRNAIKMNNVSENKKGLYIHRSYSNTIKNNNISRNEHGFYRKYTSKNIYHHNNIIENLEQVNKENSSDIWDNGYEEGNFWSDYTGLDKNGDGVGDTNLPHNGVDDYPLMVPVDITGDYDYTIKKYDEKGYGWNELLPDFLFILFASILFFIWLDFATRPVRKKKKTPKQALEQELKQETKSEGKEDQIPPSPPSQEDKIQD
jgi:parallel beta-helix repeat protein